MKCIKTMICFAIIFSAASIVDAQYAFNDMKLNDEKRIDLLLDMLTLDEKISLLSTNHGVPRLGIPDCGQREGLHGIAIGGPANWGIRKVDADGRMTQVEYPTTIFPQSYGLGETWDTDLLHDIGTHMAEEMRWYAQSPKSVCGNNLVLRAPNADLGRDPRWGRTEECFGEDAWLTSSLNVAMIKGLQGDNPRYWKTAALMKHFLANSNEDGRDSTSSDFSERMFREYYAYPFYRGIIEGGSRAFMASYNAWNGTVMCANPILESIARKEWGMNGIICTDGGALGLLISAHHAYKDRAEGAAATVKATTGQFLDRYVEDIREALNRGILTEQDIDKAIRGNLFISLRLGLLDGDKTDNPYISIGRDTTLMPPFLTDEAKSLARKAVAKSIVLMKNDGAEPLLPINTDKVKKILVVGPYADQIVQDWYSGCPPYVVTIAQGLREALADKGVEVVAMKDNAMGKAELKARECDLVIVCTGNHPFGTKADWKFCPVPSDGREAVDRQSLMLPDEDMVRLLYRANPNTILVLVSSFPYAINWSKEHLPAIVHITHCAQEQGNGLADVLLGKVSPAGRLTQTWVSDICQLPSMIDYDLTHGRTYMFASEPPLFAFGHGLSYTSFGYGKPVVVRNDGGKTTVRVPVTNTGKRDGEEVVQVYARFLGSKVVRPNKLLCAFRRVMIPCGTTVEVEIDISHQRLSYWDESKHRFVAEPCDVDLMIGASSDDIRVSTVISL